VKEFPEHDLLGYVVGALEAQERHEIQEAIEADPHLDEQLLEIKRVLSPLEYLDNHGSRPGLARRTCEMVANIGQPPVRRFDPSKINQLDPTYSGRHAAVVSVLNDTQNSVPANPSQSGESELNQPAAKSQNEPSRRRSPFRLSPVSLRERQWGVLQHSRFSPVDLIVAGAAVMILAGLLFPVLAYTRHQSRLNHCQDNLRELGTKLAEYSELNHGRFVEIPRTGPLAVAGIVGPMLKDKGLFDDDSLFACPGVMANSGQRVRIPKLRSIQNAIGDRLIWLQKTMSGNYGYTLGYQTSNGYETPTNLARSNVILMSDAPAFGHPSRISTNHGGDGQNCLFEDGHVRWVPGETFGEDAIFVNDYNLVAPGCRPEDNVIAPSHLSPLFPMSQ
jgi:hypothetical protein